MYVTKRNDVRAFPNEKKKIEDCPQTRETTIRI